MVLRRRTAIRRHTARLTLIFLLISLALGMPPATQVAEAAEQQELSVSKTAADTVLAGEELPYEIRVTNIGVDGYNLSVRDHLPPGVTYVSGTSPRQFGEPQIIAVPGDETTPDSQILIWSNISDLPASGTQVLRFSVRADEAVYPVGSVVTNDAQAFLSENERIVPRFDAQGAPRPHDDVTSADTATAAQTRINPVKIEKSEPSPEHELMRGVHDQSTVYTLTVTNNQVAKTGNVVVTDYLPAQLEFLGCGEVSNGGSEYGGRSIAETPAVGGCIEPVSVETVQLGADDVDGINRAGIYTKVVWELADLGIGAQTEIKYAAGIPQRANALFGGEAPSPESKKQTANLDNNTGPSTRELAGTAGSEGAQFLRNYATVEGVYTGPVVEEADSAARDITHLDVTAEDLAIHKTSQTDVFKGQSEVEYTLRIRTSEYVTTTNAVVVDVLPDGLCMASDADGRECATAAEDVYLHQDQMVLPAGVTVSVTGLDYNETTGETRVTFELSGALPPNSDFEIKYPAPTLSQYGGTNHNQAPTVSGDAFTNNVSISGTTTSLAHTNPPQGDAVTIENVVDTSSSTVRADFAQLTKTIGTNTTDSAAYSCDADGVEFVTNQEVAANDPALTFSKGDLVCFTLRVEFSEHNSTKNPAIRDFLPDHLEFDSAVATSSNTVSVATPNYETDGLVWRPGVVGSNGDRFVDPGGVFEYEITARVVADPNAGEKPDLTGNLAKLTWVNTIGEIDFLRDQVDFSIASTPPVSLDKAVAGANSGIVSSGDTLTYTVTVTNDGAEENRNNVPMTTIEVWDRLPDTVMCDNLADISDGGTCADEIIRWTLSGPLDPGESVDLTYELTIPENPRVAFEFINTAGVRSYQTSNNQNENSPHFPQENIDPSVPETDQNVPPAHDSTTVRTVDVAITKTQTTGIDATNNNAPTQAVIGETITYTVTGTVPAHSTVYQGEITDTLPSGIEYISSTAHFNDSEPLPAGTEWIEPTETDAAVKISLGNEYTNTTDVDQEFTLTITARVTQTQANVHGTQLTNTGYFKWADNENAENENRQTAPTTAHIIEPRPSITKTDNVDAVVHANQEVTYTLTVRNANGRPTLNAAVVEDCLPAGLTFKEFVDTPPEITSEAGTCADGGTLLRWSGFEVLAGAGNAVNLKYTATVDPAAAGANSYRNTAEITGNSISADPIDEHGEPENGRLYTASTFHDVQVEGATVTKSTGTPQRTIGEVARFEITVTLPPNVNFYDAVVHDTLPQYIDPATLVWGESGTTCTPANECNGFDPEPQTANGQTIGWSLGSLAASDVERTITIPYSATVVAADQATPSAGDDLVNSAFFGWELTTDTDPAAPGATPSKTSNKDTATVTIVEPDLTISKVANKTSAEIGDSISYTVRIDNIGSSTAHDIIVVDQIPPGLVVDTASIGGGGIYDSDERTITWELPLTIGAHSTIAVTYRAELQTTVAAQENTVQITHYRGLPVGVEEAREYVGPEDTAEVEPILPLVNVAKTVEDGPSYVDEPKTWTITATSASTATAYGVSITDALPDNWSYDADSAQVSVAGAAPVQVNPTQNGQQLEWSTLGNLTEQNQTIVITFTATPSAETLTDPGVGSDVDHINTASVIAHDAFNETEAPGADGDVPYNGPEASAETQIHSADLIISKTGTEPAVAGEDFTWTITVENDGPDPAVGPFAVTDQLPDGYSAKTITGEGWTCSGANLIECVRINADETLAADSTFPPIEVTVAIPADTQPGTELENSVQVTAKTHDPDETNNDTTHTTEVTALADLGIVKTLTTDPLVAGEPATYELQVTNHGPSVHVGNISVIETVPEGTTLKGYTADGWNCVESGATLLCDIAGANATLAVNDSLPPITFEVDVNSDQLDAVENAATVTGKTPDPKEENNTSRVENTPTTSADLQITKSHQGDELVPGTRATYVLTVHNAGPSDAQSVTVTDELAPYLTFVDADAPAGWDCNAASGTVTCEVTALESGATAEINFRVDIAPDHTGEITNAAHVTSDTPDPNEENNTSTDGKDPKIVSDLGIEKFGPDTAIAGGDPITYQLRVTNHGPSNHPGSISVTDALPAGMECVSMGGQACSGSEAVFERGGILPSGQSFTVDVIASIAPDANLGAAENRAMVESDDETTTDPDPDNNTSTKITEIRAEANVSILKEVAGTEILRAGEEATYTLTVVNDGPSDAQNVRVVDELPAGISPIAITGPAESECTDSICTLPTLAAGETAQFTVTALIDSAVLEGTELTNRTEVSTTTEGDNPDDNVSTADITVEAWADLALTKSHTDGGEAVAGEQTTYEFLVENRGPSDAVGPLTITDVLPDGFSYLSSAGGWDCDAVDSEVTCTLPDGLIAGASAPAMTMTVHIAADTPQGEAINAATVTSPTNDPDPDNNDSQEPVEVVELADVAIVKSLTGDPLIGEEITFTFEVTNAGPSVARDVVVTDIIPDGLEIIEVTANDDWDCVVTDNQLVCALDEPLAADAQASDITVLAEVLASAYPGVQNTATVETTTPESDADNNSSTVEVPVPALVDLSVEKELTTDLLVGEEATYLLTVTNHGPTEEPGLITVRDELPTGLMAVGAASEVGDCAIDGTVVECEISGLSVDESFEIEVRVAVGPAAYPEVTNTATVTGESTDSDEHNNTAETSDPVVPLAVLNLDKTGEQDGDTVKWTLTVTNEGPNATTGAITLTDKLPRAVQFESATGPGWHCEVSAQAVECTFSDSLEPDASTQVVIVTSTDTAGGTEITNIASVEGGIDERPSTDTDDASVKIKRAAIPGLPRTGAELAQTALIALLVIALGVGVVRFTRGRQV